ncbi:hypothetical protein [Tenacibaculum sp. SG-28]|uniref:hypothetical protein n=1 Tax=Tenacibaculum sp. SG-28 TaxID=754426 RepID=UPI000CF54282|nr:hypothetical protein [Tenacibaculum sp. SG-28]PQJ19680.1 hypothetical protein BSU00_11945 [Tenacibaculum sp. SG-28]
MKKFLLLASFLALGFTANAQFSAGATFGLPVGDADNGYTFALGLDANYMFESDSAFKYGVAAGFLTYFGDEIAGFEIDNASFLPIAAAGRYGISDKFTLGADIGYAIGLSPDGNDGGFYYRPMLIYGLNERISFNLSYSGVSVDGGTFSNIGLGVMFNL